MPPHVARARHNNKCFTSLLALATITSALHAPITVHFDPKHGGHRNARGHPESTARLDRVLAPAAKALDGGVVSLQTLAAARPDALAAVARVTDADLIAKVKKASRWGRT